MSRSWCAYPGHAASHANRTSGSRREGGQCRSSRHTGRPGCDRPTGCVRARCPGACARLAPCPKSSGSRHTGTGRTAVSEGDLVQTFLPFPSFDASAAVLDVRRLGKQRVEAVQVRRGLVVPGYGWRRHPAVRMWAGYEEALVRYGLQICGAWTAGGAPIPAPPRWSETSGRGSRGVPRERRSGWPPTGTCHRGWAHRTSIEATSPPWCARTGTSTGSASRGYRTTCRTYGPGPTGRRTGPRERRSPWASSGSAQGAADGPHIVRSPVALPTQSARPERACRFAAAGEDRSRDQACR